MNYPYYLKSESLNRHLKVVEIGVFWYVQVLSTESAYEISFGRQKMSPEVFENIVADYDPSTEAEYIEALKWYFYEQKKQREAFISKYGK